MTSFVVKGHILLVDCDDSCELESFLKLYSLLKVCYCFINVLMQHFSLNEQEKEKEKHFEGIT